MPSKVGIFWNKNKRLVIHLLRLYFAVQTMVLILLAIVFLSLGNSISAISVFSSGVVSGVITFALFRIGN